MRPPCPFSTAALLAIVVASPVASAVAVTWEVTRMDDVANYTCPSTSQCTLRGAVEVARDEDLVYIPAAPGASVVVELQQTLVVDKNIEIGGTGSERVAIRPAGAFRPLIVRSAGGESVRVDLTGLTIRDGVVAGLDGTHATAPGGNGSRGGDAVGGCLLVDGTVGPARANLTRVRVRNSSVVGGRGGNGAAGLDVDRGAGGAGGHGGEGGVGSGAGIALVGAASLRLAQSSISDALAVGGDGGHGGRGGAGSLAGGAGGDGGFGAPAYGAALFVGAQAAYADVDTATFLANGLSGGNGGDGGTGGRASGGSAGAAGSNAPAGSLVGGDITKVGGAPLTLEHATLGPVSLERGVPGRWDGSSETGRSAVEGEVLFALGTWKARATVIVGGSAFSPCGGTTPQAWAGSGTNAASSDTCLSDESMYADTLTFAGGMAPTVERGRVVATPAPNSRLIDALPGCATSEDQSRRRRPQDGDGDGFPACDIGAIEVAPSPDIFRSGFESN